MFCIYTDLYLSVNHIATADNQLYSSQEGSDKAVHNLELWYCPQSVKTVRFTRQAQIINVYRLSSWYAAKQEADDDGHVTGGERTL